MKRPFAFRFGQRATITAIVLIPTAAVLSLIPLMFPIKAGTPKEFWKLACGVEQTENDPWGGSYSPRDGRYIYYLQGFHGQQLFWVRPEEAAAIFPQVIATIKGYSNNPSSPAKQKWATSALDRDPGVENDPDTFLRLYHEERLKEFKEQRPEIYKAIIEDEAEFSARWQRVNRFWLNVILECTFFVGLVLFALWPRLYGKGIHAHCFNLSLLPLLLFTPYYLGYCSWTFTSAGPCGGILYPWATACFKEAVPVWTPLDDWMFEHLPKPLEPLSQPLGPMLSISGGRPLGVVGAVLLGIGIYLVVWGYISLRHRAKPTSQAVTRLS